MAGKGIEFRATGERGRPRARGVEADAHRVPAVNVDYARALNLCACIRERTLGLAFPKERIEKRPRRPPPPTLDKIRQNIFITAIPLSPSRNLPASRVNALSQNCTAPVLINHSVLINEAMGPTGISLIHAERLSTSFYFNRK